MPTCMVACRSRSARRGGVLMPRRAAAACRLSPPSSAWCARPMASPSSASMACGPEIASRRATAWMFSPPATAAAAAPPWPTSAASRRRSPTVPSRAASCTSVSTACCSPLCSKARKDAMACCRSSSGIAMKRPASATRASACRWAGKAATERGSPGPSTSLKRAASATAGACAVTMRAARISGSSARKVALDALPRCRRSPALRWLATACSRVSGRVSSTGAAAAASPCAVARCGGSPGGRCSWATRRRGACRAGSASAGTGEGARDGLGEGVAERWIGCVMGWSFRCGAAHQRRALLPVCQVSACTVAGLAPGNAPGGEGRLGAAKRPFVVRWWRLPACLPRCRDVRGWGNLRF